MCTQAISGLESTEHPHFLQPPMAWGMPSWGQGCPQATPNTHRALGWPKPFFPHFGGPKMAIWPWQKMANWLLVSHLEGHWHLVAPTQMAPSVPMATKVARAPHLAAPMATPKFGSLISKYGRCHTRTKKMHFLPQCCTVWASGAPHTPLKWPQV